MTFSENSWILFLLAGIIVVAVLAQSAFFLIKAWRRGKAIGMEKSKLKRVATTAAIFTIAPAIAIVISVLTLSKDLGVPLPWLRLSVIGSLSYETVAAANAESAMGLEMGKVSSLTASQYVTIAFVMTICILVGIWLAPIVAEPFQKGIGKIKKKDEKWSNILFNSLFIGMISAFIGYVFCDVYYLWNAEARTAAGVTSTSGLIPILVFFVSALVTAGAGILLKKKPKWHWISDYALPISMIVGMAVAIPLTKWLG